MRDREFLQWIHGRLENVHGTSPNVDYMHKLRAIIRAIPFKQETKNVAGPTCIIFGSEITFNMTVLESEIYKKSQDIWDHASKYSDYKDGSEEAWYSFIKFLWIRFPDGREERLCDIIKMDASP